MFMGKKALFFLIAVLAFSVFNASAQSSDLEKKIFKEINKLNYYGVFDNIGFELKGQTVILSGSVVRPLTKKDAEARVEDIQGITDVVNNIEVLPLSGFDDAIRRQTFRTLADRGGFYLDLNEVNPSMRIIVKNGHVSLEGYVSNQGRSDLAYILARGVSGTFSVTNNLKVLRK